MTEERLQQLVREELDASGELRAGDRSPVSIAQQIADHHGILGLTTLVRLVIEELRRFSLWRRRAAAIDRPGDGCCIARAMRGQR